MKVVLVLLAALLALSIAQIPLCYKYRCNGKDGICDTVDLTKFEFTACKSGLTCIGGDGGNASGTCQTDPTLTQSCSTGQATCRNDKYDITCFNGICLYPGAFGPADTCSSVTTANYVNGNACANGLDCSGTCSGTLAQSGAACDDATKVCASGLYCSRTDNSTCKPRLSSGATCFGTTECAWSLICTNRGSNTSTCQTPFAQSAGQSCVSPLDCNAGLFCDPSNGQCASPSSQNTACTSSGSAQGTCPLGYSCYCRHGSPGSVNGQCFTSVFSSSLVKDLKSYWSCMGSNCNFDIDSGVATHTGFVVGYTPDSCAAKKCSGPINSGRNDAKSLVPTGGCGSGTAISVLAFLLVCVVSFVLMF